MIQLYILADRMFSLVCEISGRHKVEDFVSCVEQCIKI
jgi:hypothetical protein